MNGKGDRNRSNPKAYREGYDQIFSEKRVFARLGGGHLVHELDLKTRKALCGKDNATRTTRMRKRNLWYKETGPATCQKCLERGERT